MRSKREGVRVMSGERLRIMAVLIVDLGGFFGRCVRGRDALEVEVLASVVSERENG